MHTLQWEKAGNLSWLMGKWVENDVNMILQVRSEKLKTKMEGFDCFSSYFKDFLKIYLFVCVCV